MKKKISGQIPDSPPPQGASHTISGLTLRFMRIPSFLSKFISFPKQYNSPKIHPDCPLGAWKDFLFVNVTKLNCLSHALA